MNATAKFGNKKDSEAAIEACPGKAIA